MRRPSWAGCEGSPNRLPGVVHVVGQACGNAPAGHDRSRIGRLAGNPRPPNGEVAVDDVGVEGDDSVDDGAPKICADGREVSMVNMVGPMVTAAAAPPSKKRPTARRPRIAISHTYRPFADGGCVQRTPATKPTRRVAPRPRP